MSTDIAGTVSGTTMSAGEFDTTHAVDRARNLAERGLFKEALNALDATILLRPSMDNARLNRGLIRQHLNKHAEAIEDFDAVANYRDGHGRNSKHLDAAVVARGFSNLALGNFYAGFADYNSRPGFGDVINAARWFGTDDIKGKSLLLVGERSFDENVLLARWIPHVLEKVTSLVTLAVPPEQQPLFKHLTCNVPLVLTSVGKFDCYEYLRDLPIVFDVKRGNIPEPARFSLPLENVAAWQAPVSHRLRVGFFWADIGGTQIPLSTFKSLLQNPRIEPFSLQKHIPGHDRRLYDELPIWAMGEKVKSALDLACALKALDAVVTIDGELAHLAATLGIPCFVVLPCYRINWPWGTAQSGSAFYTAARTFRQQTPGEWESVIAEVSAALAEVERKRQ